MRSKMTTINHKESVEVKAFNTNTKNAVHFNPLKPPRRIHKKEKHEWRLSIAFTTIIWIIIAIAIIIFS